ncbi:DUF3048 domain-containing protein [Candidatus Saccharibacteria bacterium]|nr:DUF3048 domain-containing protein [Candidatus Saccharibacteria bacterium]
MTKEPEEVSIEDLKNDVAKGINLETIDTNLPEEKENLSGTMKKQRKKRNLKKRTKIIIIVVVALLAIGGGVLAFFLLNQKPAEVVEEKVPEKVPEKYYSVLTGEEIADKKLNESPTFCMQIPNGLDGARPQVGLKKAGVVFEAIAEAGITRFAAVFQNVEASALGPIRSLRLYYLDWDVPFDCTIVHAGGSAEAIAAAQSYRDLSESTTYEWRIRKGYVAPNNLFTSSELLNKFNADHNFANSDVKAFDRLKPDEAKKAVEENVKAAEPLTEEEKAAAASADSSESPREVKPLVEKISVNFGRTPAFNTIYAYDRGSNTYLRSYGDGSAHISYTCEQGINVTAPKNECGEPSQVSPSAVAVMMVDQWLDTDHYHLRTQTIGTGSAYVFQNGEAIKGTWEKSARESQIIFKDEDGKEISFAPGQLWIAAVPNSGGSVQY